MLWLSDQNHNTMKALTVLQPYASLIADQSKVYETRNWGTQYRGDIAIHAGKKFYTRYDHNNLPLGAIIAIAELVDCIEMTDKFIKSLDSYELSVGQFEIGRFAWQFANIRRIDPIPYIGNRKLWIANITETCQAS